MAADNGCVRCGEKKFFLRMKGSHVGKYCAGCGAWTKWVGSKDVAGMKTRGIPILPESAEPELLGGGDLGVRASGGYTAPARAGGSSGLPYVEEPSYGGPGPLAGVPFDAGYGVAPEEPCEVCQGEDLTPLGGSVVRLGIFERVLSVTSPDSQTLYGTYGVKFCPHCGRKL